MDQHITTPITEEVTKKLHSGDYVYITGTIYVARDAAHKRMIEALDRGDQLPIDIKDATIYYMGPSPAREGRPIGSAGPTTATRMDKYAPTLLDLGEKAMIGKGKRSKEVIAPITGIQNGTSGGRFNANNKPVSAALQSLIVIFWCMQRCHTYSARTQTATQITVLMIAFTPKFQKPNNVAGRRAIITSSIMLCVEALSLT